jgi:TetR/AcrR family transcriptional regulator, mexJK operon transcriptional repressor
MTRQAAKQPAARRGRPAKAGLQEHLLLHTLQVLLRVGYDRFSMAAVAKSAQASKETLYRHFTDKEGLLSAALQQIGTRVEPLLLAGVDDGLDRQQRLQQLAGNYLKGCLLPPSLALQRIAYANAGKDLAATFARQFTDTALSVMTRQFASMGTPNPKMDAEIFLAMVQGQLHEKALLGVNARQDGKALNEVTAHAVRIFSAYLDQ